MIRLIILFLTVLILSGQGTYSQEGKKPLKELQSNGWGTLKGTVTYDGEAPPLKDLQKIMALNNDWHFFKKSPARDLLDPTWVVNKKNKGVANVVIWLKPPPGTFFKIHQDDKKRTDTVVLDRPFCAYRPHVLTLFPRYYERNSSHETGQVFRLLNSAPINHCPRWEPGDESENPPRAVIMKPKGEMVVNFRPQKSPIRFTCTFYTWLSAYVWAFDHPYSAVSNDDGVFVIARVPIGAEVFLMAWHEDLGYVLGGKNGKKLTFTDAANRLNFKIKK